MAAAVMFLMCYVWSMVFVRIGERITLDEEKKQGVTNYTQTGELKEETNNEKT